jgi:hypothetical protein
MESPWRGRPIVSLIQPGASVPRHLLRLAACLTGVLLAVCACGSSAPPKQAVRVTQATGVPQGYSEFRDSARGYSIALPSAWFQINVQGPQAATLFDRMRKADPKLAAAAGGTSLLTLQKEHMSLFAVAASGAGANMIVSSSLAESMTKAQLAAEVPDVLTEYARAGVVVISHQIVTVAGVPAIRTQISITALGHTVPETQLILVAGGRSYTLTLDKVNAATAAEIISTLRFSQ